MRNAGFQGMPLRFSENAYRITGTPVARTGASGPRQIRGGKLGLREDLPTLLVMGGSQGASGLIRR